MTSRQVTSAWKKLTEKKMLPAEIAEKAGVPLAELRQALIDKYGMPKFREAAKAARGTKIRTGEKMVQFAKNTVAQKPTLEQYDALITNLEEAVDILIDARNELDS